MLFSKKFMALGLAFGLTVWNPQTVRMTDGYRQSKVIQQEVVSGKKEIPETELYAKSAVLMDGNSGRVLYGKNPEEIMANASTTKIMTCILALENSDLEQKVIVSDYAASMPKVHLGMQTGEEFKLQDLLYSLMLESHNDSAVAIAETVAGSVDSFAELMNEKARDIGCEHTTFLTPNGLDATKTLEDGTTVFHSTTATDLAKIMAYCVSQSPKREEFLKITGTPSYSFSDISGSRSYSCNNHNAFLSMMEGAISGKTGFTANAGAFAILGQKYHKK